MKTNYNRLLGTIVAGLYVGYCIGNPTFGHFLDSIDLVIHEAGHFLFIFFGDFVRILAGSFIQIFIPALFSGYFYWRQDYFSANFMLMWVGYNVVNVSLYMGDAIVMQLPLLGGDSVIHDWNYLFSSMGILDQTQTISGVTFVVGVAVVIVGVLYCLKLSRVPVAKSADIVWE